MSTSFPYILSKIDRELLSQDTGWASIHNELAHNQGYQQQTASLDVSLKRLHPLITGLALLSSLKVNAGLPSIFTQRSGIAGLDGRDYPRG
jgi:hypothetical protein